MKTAVICYDLKSCVHEKCTTDDIWTSQENTKMKHVKIIGMLVGACMPFASNKWHQEELLKPLNEDENNIEIKTEAVNQQEYSGKSMFAHSKIDKDTEINQKSTDKLKEHELGFKCMSFRWTSSTGAINAIKMNCNKRKT